MNLKSKTAKKRFNYGATEYAEQVAFVNWFELKYPHYLLFAIPNGEKREIFTALKLKKSGVKPGIPDLFLAYPTSTYAGLFIEMKRTSNKSSLSSHQKKIIEYLISKGYWAEVCYGCEAAIKCVEIYLKS